VVGNDQPVKNKSEYSLHSPRNLPYSGRLLDGLSLSGHGESSGEFLFNDDFRPDVREQSSESYGLSDS
jgi:hypothetical protein